jgi:hypothetical protein
VLAFENGLAGPLATRLLADLGADVIKVERPDGGDVTRAWDTVAAGLSSGFVWVNRGKRSVALDVKDPEHRPAIERLVERSDVVLQTYTPGLTGGLWEGGGAGCLWPTSSTWTSPATADGLTPADAYRPRHAGRDGLIG